ELAILVVRVCRGGFQVGDVRFGVQGKAGALSDEIQLAVLGRLGALEAGKTILAEVLKAARLSAVLRLAILGDAINAAITYVVSRQDLSVCVMFFDMFKYLRGTVCGVGIILEITDLLFQHVLDPALVPQVLEQRITVDDV